MLAKIDRLQDKPGDLPLQIPGITLERLLEDHFFLDISSAGSYHPRTFAPKRNKIVY